MKLNRVGRHGRDSEKAAAYADEDRLSNLPDDVLINILERVDTLDAIRTCILSKKMHNLLTMLSQIVILPGPRDLVRMNGIVADVTDKMLRRTRITVRRLKVRFMLSAGDCLSIGRSVAMLSPDDCLSIGRSVASAMANQRLDAAEFQISTQMIFSNEEELIYFAKQFNRFLGDCPDAFAGLTRLHLQNMSFGKLEEIPNILTTCKRLESLRLFQCDAGTHVVLKVEHARLVELDFTSCRFATLDLAFVPKLERLTYDGWVPCLDLDPVVLGFVPRLSKLILSNYAGLNKTFLLSGLLVNAPSVSDLRLDFQNHRIWVRPEGPKLLAPVLGKVRVVSLDNLCPRYDIAWTMFILEAAPSLEELCVTVNGHRCYREFPDETGVKWEPPVADLKHRNLTKLTIHGFQSDSNFTGYVRRVMEAAVNIKEVSLHDWKVCERCTDKKVCQRCTYRLFWQRCTDRKVGIKDLSSYPQTGEEMDLLRKEISEGLMMASPAVIHFRPPCYDIAEVKCL
ncbi:unnamed protein product [Alopecurus aequalis]